MGSNQYWARRVYDLCVYLMTGTPEGSTKSGFMEKPGIEPATLGLQDILHHDGFSLIFKKTFCGFSMGSNQYWAGRVYDVCLLYDGSTRRLTESGFMEKPGIEPATPGLQGIALIHYTTGASQIHG